MLRKSVPICTAALICALCLLFSGCGKGSRLEGLSAQAAELAGSYAGGDTLVTFAAEFSLDNFEGEPCHVLLLRTNDNRFFAYSYSTGQVYNPDADGVWNYDGRLATEEDRCTYLLWVSANGVSPYVNSDEARRELTAKELSEVNSALAKGTYGTGNLTVDSVVAAPTQTEQAQTPAEQVTATTEQTQPLPERVKELALKCGLTDTMVILAEEYAINDFDGEPFHVLLLRTVDNRFVAYSYSTGQVYNPDTDAVLNYDGRLETDEDRCNYLLWQCSIGDSVYVNATEEKTRLSVDALEELNNALAAENVPSHTTPGAERPILPKGTGAYTVVTDIPAILTERRLSDTAVAVLKYADLNTLRKEISTFADFAAWIALQDAPYHCNVQSNPSGQRTYGADHAFRCVSSMRDTAGTAALAVRVLGDDYGDIGMIAVRMEDGDGVNLCGNVIPAEDGGYYLFSLDYYLPAWQDTLAANRIFPDAFPLLKIDGSESVLAYCGSEDDPFYPGGVLTQAFYIPGDREVVMDYADKIYTPQNPADVVEFYRNDAYITQIIEQETGHIKPEYIDRYALSGMLGGTTLTPAEAYELLDMEPEQVKERVKTAADVLMYMLAAKIGDCGGDRCKMIGGKEWHYNLNAFEVMEQRLANCGASANLANYLLEGDYEEIGFILHAYYIGDGGGHVYNYIRYEGSYYIVDFSWYIFGDYRPTRDFPVMRLDRLEDYGKRIPELYGGVCMALAHTSPGQHYPNVFDDANEKYAIPAGTEYQLLYQEERTRCYLLAEYPLDQKQLDWTVFG